MSPKRLAALQTAVQAARAGVIVPRAERPRFFGLPVPIPVQGIHPRPSLEQITADLDALARAPWLTGVLFHIDALHVDPATAFALRQAIGALAAAKRTMAYLTQIDLTGYYIASATAEIVVPESADVGLRGLGLSITFMRDALARLGVRFEKLAIDEYKNAFDTLVRQEMSPAHREQLEALLDRFEAHAHAEIGKSRGLAPDAVRALIDEG